MNTSFETQTDMSARPPASTAAGVETVNVAISEEHAVSRRDEWDQRSRSALAFEVVCGIHREHAGAVLEVAADPAVAAFASDRQTSIDEALTSAYHVDNGPTSDTDPAAGSDRASANSELSVAVRAVSDVFRLCAGQAGEGKHEDTHREFLHDLSPFDLLGDWFEIQKMDFQYIGPLNT
jgi:hypothetical protein